MARVRTLVKQQSKSKPLSRSSRPAARASSTPCSRQVDVPPAGEAVLEVPLRLAVPQQDERRHQASTFSRFALALGGRLLQLGQDRVERVEAGEGEIFRALRRPAVDLVGQVEIVLERHFEGHRHAAVALGELGRRHRHVGLARRRDLIALLALEIGREPLERLAEQLEQLLLAVGERGDALESGEEVGRDRLVAVDVHREIDAGLVHRIADAQHFGALLGRRRVPFAVEVHAGGVGARCPRREPSGFMLGTTRKVHSLRSTRATGSSSSVSFSSAPSIHHSAMLSPGCWRA